MKNEEWLGSGTILDPLTDYEWDLNKRVVMGEEEFAKYIKWRETTRWMDKHSLLSQVIIDLAIIAFVVGSLYLYLTRS